MNLTIALFLRQMRICSFLHFVRLILIFACQRFRAVSCSNCSPPRASSGTWACQVSRAKRLRWSLLNTSGLVVGEVWLTHQWGIVCQIQYSKTTRIRGQDRKWAATRHRQHVHSWSRSQRPTSAHKSDRAQQKMCRGLKSRKRRRICQWKPWFLTFPASSDCTQVQRD